MKNARKYEPKVRKLLKSMSKFRSAGPPEHEDPIETLLVGILETNCRRKRVGRALASLEREFVDFNELRVSQPKEIAEIIGESYPGVDEKARLIREVLNAIFHRVNSLDVGYMADMPKRELRRHLRELGLGTYPAAYLVLTAFDGHAVCVDDMLVGCLEMDGYIAPGTDQSDAQGFLERIIQRKDALAAHEVLRAYAERRASALARKRRAQVAAAEKAEAEEKARAEAERKRKRRLAAKKARAKKARAKKAAAKKRAKTARAKPSAAAKKRKPRKRPAGPAKKAAKKPAKKSAKGKAAKAAKKAPKKSAKKPARKRSKTTRGKGS